MGGCRPWCSIPHPCRVSACPNAFAVLASPSHCSHTSSPLLEADIQIGGPPSTNPATGNQSWACPGASWMAPPRPEPGAEIEGRRLGNMGIQSQPCPPSSPPVFVPVSSQTPSLPVEPPSLSTLPALQSPLVGWRGGLDEEGSIRPPGQSSHVAEEPGLLPGQGQFDEANQGTHVGANRDSYPLQDNNRGRFCDLCEDFWNRSHRPYRGNNRRQSCECDNFWNRTHRPHRDRDQGLDHLPTGECINYVPRVLRDRCRAVDSFPTDCHFDYRPWPTEGGRYEGVDYCRTSGDFDRPRSHRDRLPGVGHCPICDDFHYIPRSQRCRCSVLDYCPTSDYLGNRRLQRWRSCPAREPSPVRVPDEEGRARPLSRDHDGMRRETLCRVQHHREEGVQPSSREHDGVRGEPSSSRVPHHRDGRDTPSTRIPHDREGRVPPFSLEHDGVRGEPSLSRVQHDGEGRVPPFSREHDGLRGEQSSRAHGVEGSAASSFRDHDQMREVDGLNPGILVYDNIITGDPTRVRIGEGNRAGGRVRGRVSGNRILR